MKTHLNRRALLQGLGTVGIGLPLLEEMITTNALGAAPAKVPVRAFNVFFGLGIPAPLQAEGFDELPRVRDVGDVVGGHHRSGCLRRRRRRGDRAPTLVAAR